MKLFGKSKSPTPLDLTRVSILAFEHRRTVTNQFACGKTPIDRFIKNKAKKSTERREHRVFVAQQEGSPRCIGYYSLQLGSDTVPDLPKSQLGHLQNHVAFPAVHLAFLGVDEEFQSQGLGRHLLQDVFERVALIAEHAGFHALTLQSLDDASTAFYRRLGFTEYTEGGRQPKMLYPIQDILRLTGRN